MRHPYFRDIREAEQKKLQAGADAKALDGTDMSMSGSVTKTVVGASSIIAPNPKYKMDPKSTYPVGGASVDPVKTLPSIGGGAIPVDKKAEQLQQFQLQQQQQQQLAKQLTMQQQYAQQLAKSNVPMHQKTQPGYSALPQVQGTQGSVLPQISGVSSMMGQQATSKYAGAEMGIPQVPKRRRKPRINYAQDKLTKRNGQNAEQVMKAYGIPKSMVPK
jgi:hypothetical protein